MILHSTLFPVLVVKELGTSSELGTARDTRASIVGRPPLNVDRKFSCGIRHLSRAFDTPVAW